MTIAVYTFTCGKSNLFLQIILLDTRYHRDCLSSDGTILGNSQWKWLEKELKGPATALTLIGSSIQVVILSPLCQPAKCKTCCYVKRMSA